MALLPPDSTHQFTVSNTVFEVPKRYSLIRSVGNGSYGVVMCVPPPPPDRLRVPRSCPPPGLD